MPDEISTVHGKPAFAYNVENGHPWHRLGFQFPSYMGIEEGLAAIGVNHEEITYEPVTIGGKEASQFTGVLSSVYGPMGVHSKKYEIFPRREFLTLAFELIGLSPDSRSLDTIGNLGEHGERFFFYIRDDDIIIDPNGIADVIENGYMGVTSFDGTQQNTIGKTAIRAVCANTVAMGLRSLEKGIKATHHPGADRRLRFLAELQDYAGAYEAAMIKRAEEMLRVPGSIATNKILDGFWRIRPNMDQASYTKAMQNRSTYMSLYDWPGNTNKEAVGDNGWAAYNAFTEYADHWIPVRGGGRNADKVRAERAVFPGNVWKQKVKAAELVLS